MPLQAVTPRPASDDAPMDVSSYLENLKQNLAEIHSNVRDTLKKSSYTRKGITTYMQRREPYLLDNWFGRTSPCVVLGSVPNLRPHGKDHTL